jgi:hypothetical protein
MEDEISDYDGSRMRGEVLKKIADGPLEIGGELRRWGREIQSGDGVIVSGDAMGQSSISSAQLHDFGGGWDMAGNRTANPAKVTHEEVKQDKIPAAAAGCGVVGGQGIEPFHFESALRHR